MKPLGPHKVLVTSILHVDESGNSLLLCEIFHTSRDYMPTLQCLQFLESQLSRIAPAKDEAVSMASRAALPSFAMTDKDGATQNALAKWGHGCR